jgi:hypothetical protein
MEDTTLVANPEKRQKTIHSWFGGKSPKVANTTTEESKNKPRTLQTKTAENWKTISLAKYNAALWLIINEDQSNKNLVASFNCSICREFEDRISSIKGFNHTWIKEGSKRLQLNAAKEHAEGEPHKKAFDLHLQNEGLTVRERSETTHQNVGGIVRGLDVMKQKDFELTKKKFETAYFVVKEELPITKFTKILELEEKHGVALGKAYRNNMSGSTMIDFIGKWLSNELKKELEEADFFSILTDGSTDVSIIEKEAIFVITFDPSPPGTDRVGVKVSYLDLADLHGADAKSVLECIKASVKSVYGDEFMPKLVGFGSDGASVNTGKKEGVKTLLQQENPWITFGWCVAHRLELALKDSLKGTSFDDVDELILRVYYLYKRSPKKLRQLKELAEIYSDSFEFVEGGYRPKKASGTRWIAHKTRALDIIIDKYGILMQHLESLSQDKSYPTKERAKFKGWLIRWTQARIPLLACVSVEVLAPAKILSKAFQSENVDVVQVESLLNRCEAQLSRVECKPFDQLPTVKRFLENVKEQEDGSFTYLDVKLKDFMRGKESSSRAKNQWSSKIAGAIENRLGKDEDSVISKHVQVLNTEGWFRATNDPDFLYDKIEALYNFFKSPLDTTGHKGSVSVILEQFDAMIKYALQYLNVSKTDYRVVWRKLFESSKSHEWKSALLLVKLLFTLPVSNAKVERLFSLMNRVKTDTRNSLSKDRLSSLLRICMEGPSLQDFDPKPSMTLWKDAVVARRPSQNKRKAYKERAPKKQRKTLMDYSDSSTSVSDESEE